MYKNVFKELFKVVLIILVTQTVFFIVSSYLANGDPFLGVKNFYYMTYDVRI
ncbi:hypothetical protein [Methanobrevibacter sp.]